MKVLYCGLLLLCLQLNGLAQPMPTQDKGLNIGDTMPDIMLPVIYNHALTKGKFSALQKELTIIDFWASWCGSCVGSFNKVQALQQRFSDRLQMLMVNASPKEDAKKITAFLQKRQQRTGKKFTLAYSLQDTVFSKLFPFKVIPHCIWLDKNRKVIAITDSDALTADNIEAVLNGSYVSLPFKNDALLFDETRDVLLATDSTENNKQLLYQSFITSGQQGLGVKLSYQSAGSSLVKKLRVLNYHLLQLYQVANPASFANSAGRMNIDSTAARVFEMDKPEAERSAYCYELQTRPIKRKEALQFLASDLERYFNIRAIAKDEMINSYVLTPAKNISSLYTKGDAPGSDFDKGSVDLFISNGSMASLATLLSVILKRPVVDETGINTNIDIRMPVALYDYSPAQLKTFLSQKGINLTEGKRLLPVTYISTINQP